MDKKRLSEGKNIPELGRAKKVSLELKETTRLDYPKLDENTTNKLNEIFEEVHSKVSIDYSINQEILDIKAAVRIMLERVVARVNGRGRFSISRIQPCGSMVEGMAVWKYDEGPRENRYTEADFLAILADSPVLTCRSGGGCQQCAGVSVLPVNVNRLKDSEITRLFDGDYPKKKEFDRLFLSELNTCLGSACNCFSVLYKNKTIRTEERTSLFPSYSYKLSTECESDYRCDKCVVEMPTGILRVNHKLSVGPAPRAENCSLAFTWTSKAKTLSVYDKFLQEKAECSTSLSVHVDFLPAIEIFKADSYDGAPEHDFFLLPKRCNGGCRAEQWRKSNCLAEIAYIVHVMSEKHKKCYKIIKYFLSRDVFSMTIDWYHVKTAALNHSRECSDASEDCAVCVLKMLTELKHSYDIKTLNSFHYPDVNMFNESYAIPSARKFELTIKLFCTVKNIDSSSMLLQAM